MFLIDRVFDETLDTPTRVGCAAIATKYLHPTLCASRSLPRTVVKVDPGELLNRIADRIAKQVAADRGPA